MMRDLTGEKADAGYIMRSFLLALSMVAIVYPADAKDIFLLKERKGGAVFSLRIGKVWSGEGMTGRTGLMILDGAVDEEVDAVCWLEGGDSFLRAHEVSHSGATHDVTPNGTDRWSLAHKALCANVKPRESR